MIKNKGGPVLWAGNGPGWKEAMSMSEVRRVMRRHEMTEQVEADTGRGVVGPRNDLADLPALLSVPRAAAILGLSRASAYRFAAAGDLPCRRLGGRLFVVTSRLEAFLSGADVRE
ncbi:MAG TPA: helix-turn-helix domain-containing protein [Microlunatus sp.]